jgi:hypothetical protein
MSKDDYKTKPSREYRYFLFDPEVGGMMFFRSLEDRDKAAEESISEYKDVDSGWSEDVESLLMGEVTHICTQVDVIHRPPADELDEGCDGSGLYWPEDIALFCDYKMLPT